MQEIDKSLLNELIEIIYQRIEEKFKKQLNNSNIEFSYDGIVRCGDSESVPHGATTNVELAFGALRAVQNLSGVALSNNDKVRIFYNKNNVGKSYIGVKF